LRPTDVPLRALLRPSVLAPAGRAYALGLLGRRAYRSLSADELRASRRSDTVFVFGSGRSLVDITPDEWARIAEHDTFSLREFPRQQFVRADYHMTGEVDFLDEYAQRIRDNPRYADTVFLVQGGWRGSHGNELIGRRLLLPGASVFRFRRTSRARYSPPSRRFDDGIVHGFNSIISATNLAILIGWRRIVLTGVDLYNKEYFWLPPGETRTYEQPEITAESLFTSAHATIDLLRRWHDLLEPEGTELRVYNPRSLLAEHLGVFSWDS
jgi:hypothetical protein